MKDNYRKQKTEEFATKGIIGCVIIMALLALTLSVLK
jgi:hypothetical protein